MGGSMKKWVRRMRGALALGVIWAVAWGFVGFLMEIFVDPHGRIADIWPAVLGYPAFFGGVFFSFVLGMAARGRKFHELSFARFAAWGALAGLLVGMLPFVLGSPAGNISAWRLAVLIIPPITLLTAVSAVGSLAIARSAEKQDSLEAGEDTKELHGHTTMTPSWVFLDGSAPRLSFARCCWACSPISWCACPAVPG
jgi:hypothetical protein